VSEALRTTKQVRKREYPLSEFGMQLRCGIAGSLGRWSQTRMCDVSVHSLL